ncbi:MAG: hypothetical protein K0R12_294 [Gammaproteobacteria bacterium]|jgi:hypothetical protein|nr:hypothetical protein [Gammaproteobacteria bacterium]
MKLKSIVVASAVFVLGLGASAYASTGVASASSKTDPRQDMTDLQSRSSQIEATLNQNEGSALAAKPYLGDDWTKRVVVSGELNVDAKARSTYGPTGTGASAISRFQDEGSSDIYLNNSQIDIDAFVNSWTQAHISLTGNDPMEQDAARYNSTGDNAPINLDEAYVTVGNLDKYPVYGTFGRQYVPFGMYDRHAIEPSLSQYLSQTQATAAKVGVAMPMGVYGSLYTFRGNTHTATSTDYNINDFGAEVGYANHVNAGSMPLGYQVSVGYLHNLADVDWISYVDSSAGDPTPAMSANAKLTSGPFSLAGNYVTALEDFGVGSAVNGDSPWAFDLTGGYNFDVMGHDSNFSLTYQQSGETEALGLPKRRYGGMYTVGVLKDTSVTFMLLEDENFDNNAEDFSTEGAVRLSVDF